MDLFISADKTEDVYNRLFYEQQCIPLDKILSNFFDLDFTFLKLVGITNIYILNSRYTKVIKEDYLNKFETIDIPNKKIIKPFVNNLEVINTNRYHFIDQLNIIQNTLKGRDVLLLESYLDYNLIKGIKTKIKKCHPKKLLIINKIGESIDYKVEEYLKDKVGINDIKHSNPNPYKYIGKYIGKHLIDFIVDYFKIELKVLQNELNNKSPYYIWGEDEILMNSFLSKIYNDITRDKYYIKLEKNTLFRVPLNENIFLLLKEKFDEELILKEINKSIFKKSRIFICNYTSEEYPLLDKYYSVYIPKLKELETQLPFFFIYFLLFANKNGLDLAHLIIELEDDSHFFKEFHNISTLSELKQFTHFIDFNTSNLKTVNALKNEIKLNYRIWTKNETSNVSNSNARISGMNNILYEDESPKFEDDYQFIKKPGGNFKIVFKGEDIILPNQNYDGLIYIQGILRYGGRTEGINCSELYNLKSSPTFNTLSEKYEVNKINSVEDGENKAILFTDSKTIKKSDNKTVKEIEKTIKDLDDLSNQYEQDPNMIEELEEKKYELLKELNRIKNIHGRIKNEGSELQKNFRRVSNRFDLVMEKIEIANKNFFDYLNNSIKLQYGKYSYKYFPSSEINWVLDENKAI